jgi:hypothetical protein
MYKLLFASYTSIKLFKNQLSWAWWLRQKDCEFEVSLGYIQDPVSKTKQKKKKKNQTNKKERKCYGCFFLPV